MRNKNTFIKNLLYLAIITTVVVVTWVASSLYYSLTDVTVTEDVETYSEPISPVFDPETLNQVGNRTPVPVDLAGDPADYVDPDNTSAPISTTSATIEDDSEDGTEEDITDEDNIDEDNTGASTDTVEQTPEPTIIPEPTDSL